MVALRDVPLGATLFVRLIVDFMIHRSSSGRQLVKKMLGTYLAKLVSILLGKDSSISVERGRRTKGKWQMHTGTKVQRSAVGQVRNFECCITLCGLKPLASRELNIV